MSKLHRSLLEVMSHLTESESNGTERVTENATLPTEGHQNHDDPVAESEVARSPSLDPHPSVKSLLETYPTLALEGDLQNLDLAPSLTLNKGEADKYLGQLQYDPAETEESSLNKQYYDLDSCLEDAPPASPDLSAEGPHKFYYRHNYYADPDYYVFKARKRKFDELSDAASSDWDSGGSDSETPNPTTRSRYKFSGANNSDSDSELLGFSRTNDEVRVCEYCDKTCHSRSQLRHHERNHRKCQVCHKVFRTDDALELHLNNVCYRRIEETQPCLQMTRVDDDPLLVKKYQSAFDYFFSRMNDETYEGYGKRDEDFAFDKDFPLYHTDEDIESESVYITDAFRKFQNVQNVPVRRNKICQTRKSDIIVKYSSQNQIILRDLFTDLLLYKVPIQMVVDQKISAHISYTTRPTLNKVIHSWAELNAIDVGPQPKLLDLSSTPVLHINPPKPVASKNPQPLRPKPPPKNKGANTKTTANPTAKVAPLDPSINPPNPTGQFCNAAKTPQNETSLTAIKREEEPVVTPPNPTPSVIFKIPFNPPAPTATRFEPQPPPIKEEPTETGRVSEPPAHPHNFRFPYNSNSYPRNPYPPQNSRLQTRPQYLTPPSSDLTLNNLLLLKTTPRSNIPPSNGGVFFPSRSSAPSPNSSVISSPVNTVAPFFPPSSVDHKSSLPYPPLNSYEAEPSFPPPINSAYPPDGTLYNPYPPPNGFRSSTYSTGSYQPTSGYAPQYTPPYNHPMGEYGFADSRSLHMLPPQHLGTGAVGGKVFLRVKQPWEINQK